MVLEELEGAGGGCSVLGRATVVLKDWKAPAVVAEILAELQMILNGPVVGRAAPAPASVQARSKYSVSRILEGIDAVNTLPTRIK